MKRWGFWTTIGGLAALIILLTHPSAVKKEAYAGGGVFADDFRALSGYRPQV